MQLQDLERVGDSFARFHAEFAPVFGHKPCRERSRDYLNGLLVQNKERRNAENLSETVASSARGLQRFLTEARWSDRQLTAHLQEYLAPRLAHPQAVFAVDESGVVKQGKKSVGVARQYCGAVGKIANCQIGVYLAHVGPRGRAIVDKSLYLPREWIEDPERMDEADVPQEARVYKSKSELALALLQRAVALGYLHADWVTADDEYGKSPSFRDGVEALGLLYAVEVPTNTPVWPIKPAEEPTGRARSIGCGSYTPEGCAQEVGERAKLLAAQAWEKQTVAQGEQGPRTYLFACERAMDSRDAKPGRGIWVVYRKNLDGTEPRYYFSNAPEGVDQRALVRACAARWPIETEFETNKSLVGLSDYEVRGWWSWHHHISMCLLASAFLLSLQQEWGEKYAADHPAPGIPGGLGAVAKELLHAA